MFWKDLQGVHDQQSSRKIAKKEKAPESTPWRSQTVSLTNLLHCSDPPQISILGGVCDMKKVVRLTVCERQGVLSGAFSYFAIFLELCS